jgi:hypothetical protein
MMSFDDQSNPFSLQPPPAPRAGTNPLWWVFGAGIAFLVVCCGGLVAGLAYVGVVGPETSVYVGNQVPERFLKTAREVRALEEGEQVRFFYSDGFTNIRDGFYFVSDQKVVIYIEDGRELPLTAIPLDKIEHVELSRDESFLNDSEITIETTDGDYFAFPVSSEFDRDEAFFRAIEDTTQGE